MFIASPFLSMCAPKECDVLSRIHLYSAPDGAGYIGGEGACKHLAPFGAARSEGLEALPSLDQQSTTERANPASLVSLYLLFMSLAVSASAITVASKSTRCLEAISLLAIA